jgi:hypothetical protein
MRSLCAGAAAGLILSAVLGLGARQNDAGSIWGLLTDTTGRGLPGATVTAVSTSAGTQTTVTDASGRYRLERLPAGHYLVKASMSGFVTRILETTVTAGRDRNWSGALLVGRVADESSIESKVMRLTGSDARDCGRHGAPASEAALRRSLDCAVTSARAHQPFSVILQRTGSDSQSGAGLLAGSDGLIRLFEYDHGGAKFASRQCPAPDVKPSRTWSGAEFEFTCPTIIPVAF